MAEASRLRTDGMPSEKQQDFTRAPTAPDGVPPAQRETRSCVTERATSLKGDIYSSTSVRGACQLKNPVWKTELSDGRLSLMLSCNCLSCLPGECRPPDGWTAHTLPCPEGQGYLNFRPSGESCLSGEFSFFSLKPNKYEKVHRIRLENKTA